MLLLIMTMTGGVGEGSRADEGSVDEVVVVAVVSRTRCASKSIQVCCEVEPSKCNREKGNEREGEPERGWRAEKSEQGRAEEQEVTEMKKSGNKETQRGQ